MKNLLLLSMLLITSLSFSQESLVLHLVDGGEVTVEGYLISNQTTYTFQTSSGKDEKIKKRDVKAISRDGMIGIASLPITGMGTLTKVRIVLYSDDYVLGALDSEDYTWFYVWDREWNIIEKKLDVHQVSFPKGKAKRQAEENVENINKVAEYFSGCDEAFEKMKENVGEYNDFQNDLMVINCGAERDLQLEDFDSLYE
ncbi:MAG: hypothetical protein NXI10_15055 [bacterium]|nr:hypothetical protein [bacterium]